MPPTSKKLRRHIGLGLSVRAWVTLYMRSRTVRDRILKFDMWNKYEKKEDPYFFFFFFFFFLFRRTFRCKDMPLFRRF